MKKKTFESEGGKLIIGKDPEIGEMDMDINPLKGNWEGEFERILGKIKFPKKRKNRQWEE